MKSKIKVLAKEIAKSASDLKAADIRVLDLGGLCSFTDYFVVCSGTSDRHVRAVADRILEDQKNRGNSSLGVEGYEGSDWILVDFGSVVAHIFQDDTRRLYNIERLWGDAARINFKGITGA